VIRIPFFVRRPIGAIGFANRGFSAGAVDDVRTGSLTYLNCFIGTELLNVANLLVLVVVDINADYLGSPPLAIPVDRRIDVGATGGGSAQRPHQSEAWRRARHLPGAFLTLIAPSHGTLCVCKKVILPWRKLKSSFLRKTGPSGLRKRCYAEEILWNTEEWNTLSFNCPKAIVGDGK
jgi:hypothetical protein